MFTRKRPHPFVNVITVFFNVVFTMTLADIDNSECLKGCSQRRTKDGKTCVLIAICQTPNLRIDPLSVRFSTCCGIPARPR
jgi:hypothetical protein